MVLVCPSCGKENRENARYCRGCARPLDTPGASPDVEAARRERVARARRRAQRRKAAAAAAGTSRPARSLWPVILVAAVLVLAGGWWMTRHRVAAPVSGAPQRALGGNLSGDVLPAAAASTPAPQPAAAEAQPEPPGTAAAVERLRESVERLAQEDRVKAAALDRQRRDAALQKQRAEDARRRTDALANHSATAPETPMATPAGAPAVTAVAPPAPAAPAPAAAPVVASVDQQCAGAGNLFARDFCRIRECGNPARAADPVCVRFRQMDEARRREAELR